MTDNATIASALEEAFGEHLLDADGLSRFTLIDLAGDDLADSLARLEHLDMRTDVRVWTTFRGSLEEPPEFAMGGDWAVLDGPAILASGKILDEGEWEGDPFFFLRDSK